MFRSLTRVLAAVVSLATLNGCGGTSTSTSINPNSPGASRCGVAATAQPTSVGAPGGSGAIVVSTNRECAWEARSQTDWLSLGQSRTGQGDGTVSWAAGANPVVSERRGVIEVNGVTVEIAQAAAACAFGIDPSRSSVDAAGGRHTVAVTAQAGCAWAARSDVPWLSIASGAGGNGGGTVVVEAAVNTSPQPRSGTLTIAGLTYTVEQAGMTPSGGGGGGGDPIPPTDPACRFTVTPTSGSFTADGGVIEVNVTASAPTCVWTAQSAAPWISLEGGVTDTGNGRRRFHVAANTTSVARTGTVGVAGTVITITQAGAAAPSPPCTFTIAPTTASFPTEGGTGEIAVTASAATCAWTAQSGVPWISIQGGTGGTGSGLIRYTLAANPDQTLRPGTLTVAGQVVSINQAPAPAPPAPCTFTIAPTTAAFPAEGGGGEIVVTASAPTCVWTSLSGVPWIIIQGGPGGTGSGPVRYTVAANPDQTSRPGTLTVAGHIVTITQAAAAVPPPPCTFSVAPTSASIPAEGGSGSVSVTASASTCTWRATTSDPWITVPGESRTGSGPLTFTAAPNPSPAARTGNLAIDGQTVTITQAGAREEATVSGAISDLTGSCPNLTFIIAGRTIVTNAATEYRGNESCQDLRNGRTARARGRVQADGSIIADRVDNIGGGGDAARFAAPAARPAPAGRGGFGCSRSAWSVIRARLVGNPA